MSQKAPGYERISGDRYFTPAWVTQALVSVERFPGLSIDPACGGWHMVAAMRAEGLLCDGFDINPEPAPNGEVTGLWATQDFLTWDGRSSFGTSYRNIVTNPPYGTQGRLAVKFIEHALKITQARNGKVAMLLRVDFDSAHGRRPIFEEHPAFAAKYTLTKRVRWENIEQSDSGPSENHAWFVWDWSRQHPVAIEGRQYGYLP